MANFRYQAITAQGKRVEQSISADTAEQAQQLLRAQGLLPVWVHPLPLSNLSNWLTTSRHTVSTDDLILFAQQMQALTKAGLPLTQALLGLAKAQANPHWQRVLQQLHLGLTQGKELSQGMSQLPKVFNPMLLSLVQVGESTGNLSLAFASMAKQLQQEKRSRRQWQQATRYPLFVLIATLVALFVLSQWVVPQFSAMLGQLGGELPWPTQAILTGSALIRQWGWLVALLLVTLAMAHQRGRKRWSYRVRTDRWLLQAWPMGSILRRLALRRFTSTLAELLARDVPLLNSLTLCSKVVNNAHMQQAIIGIRQRIEQGESLLKACEQSLILDSALLQMISVGEETAQMPSMLNSMSEFYEQEIDHDLQRLSQTIEPLLLLVLTLLVALLALGVFLPTWDLYQQLG